MKRHLGYVVLLSYLCALQGCATLSNVDNLIPTPSVKEFDTFSSTLPGASNDTASIAEFKTQLVAYIGQYHMRASERRKMEWESSGMTSYGGLVAVIGALADKTGLLNSGAGLAGLGLMTSARYNFGQQSQIYLVAVRRLACVNSKLVVISNTVFDDARNSPDAHAAAVAKGAVRHMTDLVDGIRIDANNGLLGIAPGTPSRDELLAMLRSYLPAAATAAASAPPAPDDADSIRRKEAGEQIKSLLTDVATCTKL